jgi:hypothetical protein
MPDSQVCHKAFSFYCCVRASFSSPSASALHHSTLSAFDGDRDGLRGTDQLRTYPLPNNHAPASYEFFNSAVNPPDDRLVRFDLWKLVQQLCVV